MMSTASEDARVGRAGWRRNERARAGWVGWGSGSGVGVGGEGEVDGFGVRWRERAREEGGRRGGG